MRLVATCSVGLEEFVERELNELGMEDVRPERGAVRFGGDAAAAMCANLHLRCANRVLVELASWRITDDQDLEMGMRAILGVRAPRRRKPGRSGPRRPARAVEELRLEDHFDPGELLSPDRSFAVHATCRDAPIRDGRWAALRLKDGLVDAQRARFGKRAAVDRESPDLALRLRLLRDRAFLLLDTTGRPLDRRGYRLQAGEAPLRETLAAACVFASGWDGNGVVVDPMCGSGTLLIEAGLWAAQAAPGLLRDEGFGFEGLPGFSAERWAELRTEAERARREAPELFGNDRDASVLEGAAANAARAGLGERLVLNRGRAEDWTPPPGPGLVLINPPYGERLGSEPEDWKRLGDLLKQRFGGYTAVVVAGDPARGKHIGLKPRRRVPVRNGPLDARLLVFDLWRGSRD